MGKTPLVDPGDLGSLTLALGDAWSKGTCVSQLSQVITGNEDMGRGVLPQLRHQVLHKSMTLISAIYLSSCQYLHKCPTPFKSSSFTHLNMFLDEEFIRSVVWKLSSILNVQASETAWELLGKLILVGIFGPVLVLGFLWAGHVFPLCKNKLKSSNSPPQKITPQDSKQRKIINFESNEYLVSWLLGKY